MRLIEFGNKRTLITERDLRSLIKRFTVDRRKLLRDNRVRTSKCIFCKRYFSNERRYFSNDPTCSGCPLDVFKTRDHVGCSRLMIGYIRRELGDREMYFCLTAWTPLLTLSDRRPIAGLLQLDTIRKALESLPKVDRNGKSLKGKSKRR